MSVSRLRHTGTIGPMPIAHRLRLSSPADILAAIPYLLGFHPADSLVVIGLEHTAVRVATRWDLPLLPGALDDLRPLLAREKADATVLAAYGEAALTAPALDDAVRFLAAAGVAVHDALRTHEGRYWSHLRPCPPEGVHYDAAAHPVAAEAVVRGMVALPDRAALERTVAPVTGAARTAMDRATEQAEHEVWGWVEKADPAAYLADGIARVRSAVECYERGGRLSDDDAARLGLALWLVRVRDEAWTLIDDRPAHLTLWRDLTRRLSPGLVTPSAALLAAAAWRTGDCALASMALDRALAAEPRYTMALILTEAIARLLTPDDVGERMPTPEQLDREMGPPLMSWFTPLLRRIAEPPA
ncbi:DUF4192 domain-containing protein [Herbidospora yilanensis]|uniref:DUF4192 domain-containing protein n=1 Tax=Herbidospora yilanensis TaxID=354426 RepID=UPI000AB4510E|nr:DUF4192 domain-containing protein [Herbidospora yilanensis]